MEDIYSYSDGKKKPEDWRKEYLQEPKAPKTPKSSKTPKKAPQKKKRKTSGKGTGVKIIAVLLVLVLLLAVGGGIFYFSKLGKIRRLDINVDTDKWVAQDSLYQDKDVTNVMLVGIDRRSEKETSRSDTMILLSVDNKHKELKMTSFLRDMWLEIPGKGEGRLNAAYAYGGPELLLDTIEYNFNVRVDRVAVVDFVAFQKVVDILGGVEVEVTEKESRYLLENHNINAPAGLNKLNGDEALWYCRIRKLDSDFGRTTRQRKLMEAMVESSRNAGIFKLNTMLDNVLPLVETNLTDTEITQLGFGYIMKYEKYDVGQFSVPADGTWWNKTVNKAQVLGVDVAKNKKLLYDFIYGDAVPEKEK